jgi:hypothetical protein
MVSSYIAVMTASACNPQQLQALAGILVTRENLNSNTALRAGAVGARFSEIPTFHLLPATRRFFNKSNQLSGAAALITSG